MHSSAYESQCQGVATSTESAPSPSPSPSLRSSWSAPLSATSSGSHPVCQATLPSNAQCVNDIVGPPQAICHDRTIHVRQDRERAQGTVACTAGGTDPGSVGESSLRRGGCRHHLQRLPLGRCCGEYPRLLHVYPCRRVLTPECRVRRFPALRPLITLRPIRRGAHCNEVQRVGQIFALIGYEI